MQEMLETGETTTSECMKPGYFEGAFREELNSNISSARLLGCIQICKDLEDLLVLFEQETTGSHPKCNFGMLSKSMRIALTRALAF